MNCFSNNLQNRHDQKMAEAAVRRGVGRLQPLVRTYALVAGDDAVTIKLEFIGRRSLFVDVRGTSRKDPSPRSIEASVRERLLSEGLEP
jgi:hypothetical protein